MSSRTQPETILDERSMESTACRGMLSIWCGSNGAEIYSRPKNAQELFSVYAVANGCSFEEAMEKAAKALLTEWRRDNSEEFVPSENVIATAVELIDKIVEEQKSS